MRKVVVLTLALAFILAAGIIAAQQQTAVPSAWAYGFATPRPDHSGQFQRNIQLMYGKEDGTPWLDQNGKPIPLYRQLMNDLGVAP